MPATGGRFSFAARLKAVLWVVLRAPVMRLLLLFFFCFVWSQNLAAETGYFRSRFF
jgi:hypothetical protein